MTALDKVLALSRGEAVLDEEVMLTWSPQAREAALKSREEHKVGDRVKLPDGDHGTVVRRGHKPTGEVGYVVKKDDGSKLLAKHEQLSAPTEGKGGAATEKAEPKADPLPGPKKDEAIKAGLRVPDKYSPVGATGGYHTPQTHPDEFDSGEIKSEIKMLSRHDKKYGAHPLRAGARNKLEAHLAERAKK